MPDRCPKHGTELIERPGSIVWRGKYFPCAYCAECNSFYEMGAGWNDFMKAVRASSKKEEEECLT